MLGVRCRHTVMDQISDWPRTTWWLSHRRRYLEFMILLTTVRVWFSRHSWMSPSTSSLYRGPPPPPPLLLLQPVPPNLMVLTDNGDSGGVDDSDDVAAWLRATPEQQESLIVACRATSSSAGDDVRLASAPEPDDDEDDDCNDTESSVATRMESAAAQSSGSPSVADILIADRCRRWWQILPTNRCLAKVYICLTGRQKQNNRLF